MKIGVVIPWRSQPTRIPPFNAVTEWYKKNLPEAKIYLSDREGTDWNASGSRNDGVWLAEREGCDVLIISDADTIPQIGPLKKAIAAAYKDDLMHLPYNEYRILGEMGTRQYLNGQMLERCSHKKYATACSGTNVITPKGWWKIGGADEKFMGWGYEDTALQVAHEVINGKNFISHEGVVFALGHAPQARDLKYSSNKELFEYYLDITDPSEMLKLVRSPEISQSDKPSVKIAAYVGLYPPKTMAGAELMLHQTLLELKKMGHRIRVICHDPSVADYEGIKLTDSSSDEVASVVDWCDVMVTQADGTRMAMKAAQNYRKKLVHFVHNDKQVRISGISKSNAALIVANSEWVANTIRDNAPVMVLQPPTDPDFYKGKTGEAITLINLIELKGVNIFWQLARILPDKKFIGVKGGYGEQIIYPKNLSNVEILETTNDIKKVYAKTGIVIMPSSYESWGRVATEAMSFGIPVVVTPTPGLKESVGPAGLYADREDLASWVEAIRSLDDTQTYEYYSKAGRERVVALEDTWRARLLELEENLIRLRR